MSELERAKGDFDAQVKVLLGQDSDPHKRASAHLRSMFGNMLRI
jgi:hypothetical protein